MVIGVCLVFLVGLIWVLVGVVLTRVSATGTSVVTFYMVGCWLAGIFAWVFLVNWPVLAKEFPDRAMELAAWLGGAGALNSLGQLMLIKAMSLGHKGVSWAMVQTAMLIPFLSSLLFWKEKITLPGSAGITLLLVAIVLLSRGRKDAMMNATQRRPSTGWLMMVIGAIVLIGSSQACQAVPSHWDNWQDAASLRVCFLSTGGALANTLWVLLLRQRITTNTLRYGGMWAVLALLSYYMLFQALDRLTSAGMSCFVFPIGQAVCMIGFALYSYWHLCERFRPVVLCGMGCGVAGILFMAVR